MASTVLPNGIIIPEKYSRDWYADLYHNWQELDNLLGGGTPKDGTLTIQKNGSTVGTFSANQATDKTVNIEVPTKTSDLTNDSNFVESSDLATVATSGSYNDLSNKPTIPTVNNATLTIQKNGTTVKTFTANASSNVTANITVPTKTSDLTNDSGFITSDDTKIPLAGSNAISGDLIPSTNGTVNFGSPSYQWNQAYIKSLTINGTACGDILTHNASEFVDVTSAQTIDGRKIFSHGQTGIGRDLYLFASNPYSKNTPPANISYQYIWFSGNRASQGFENSWYGGYLEQRIYSDGSAQGRWLIRDTSENSLGIELFVNGLNKQFRPQGNNIIDLGTSSNKWKSFNGINPGALSLPSTSSNAMIQIDTTSWVLDGVTDIEYTPLENGHLTLVNDQRLEWVKGQIQNDNYYGIYRFVYKYDSDIGGIQGITIPCIKGKKVTMKIKGTGFYNALFTYCQGNV